jgi:LemA protein
MTTGGIIAIVIVAIILLLAITIIGWWISTKNTFVRYQVSIDDAASGIDVALTKRFDLLNKMFDITKGYAKHEKETLSEVIGMRAGLPKGTTPQDLSEISSKLDQAARSINLTVERYPELKANTVFLELQSASRDAEEHLQAARRMYNSNVKIYNQTLLVFPSSIVANHYHYEKRDFFESKEEERKDVKMQF